MTESEASTTPTLGHGKICYLEIPADDVTVSSRFYADVFGWQLRHHDDGSLAFDDGVGEVSGTWVTDRPPMSEPGIVAYVMVDDAAACVGRIAAAGGEIVRDYDPKAAEKTACSEIPAATSSGSTNNGDTGRNARLSGPARPDPARLSGIQSVPRRSAVGSGERSAAGR